MNGCSRAGERKRVAIANILLREPKILCMDEYSSGLDSETTANVTDLLTDIAVNRQALVVATLHQPSTYVFTRYVCGTGRLALLHHSNNKI